MKEKELKFSLKDQLFNKETVSRLAEMFFQSDPNFNKIKFINEVLKKFPELELKERIMHIRDVLHTHLSPHYKEALQQILKALPPELSPDKTDNDFGEFIIAPLGYYIAFFGCTKEYVEISLRALLEITKRFSMEGPVRFFINAFPEETFSFFDKNIQHKNYHVRRWISESTRPFLPWEIRLQTDYKRPLSFLDILYQDKTRYVVRSVANHLNDISKLNPECVIQKLSEWNEKGGQNKKEIAYLTRHALRTLIKKGNPKALELVGFSSQDIPERIICTINNKNILIGGDLSFELSIEHPSCQNILVDYAIHFLQKSGKKYKKVFKLGSFVLKESQVVLVKKKHSFKIISTRNYYPGEHFFEIYINGQRVYESSFSLS